MINIYTLANCKAITTLVIFRDKEYLNFEDIGNVVYCKYPYLIGTFTCGLLQIRESDWFNLRFRALSP